MMLSHKSTSAKSQSCVQSSKTPAHRNDDKVSIPDEEKMNRKLKVLQGKFDDNKSDKKNWIDDREDDDVKVLTEKSKKEERLGEPVQQTFANILEAVW